MGSACADLLSRSISRTTLLQCPPKSKHQIPESSLSAILAAVGEKRIPKQLDRDALGSDLYRVYGAYHFILRAQPPTHRAARVAMDEFEKAVKRFRLALDKLKPDDSPVLDIISLARSQITTGAEYSSSLDDTGTFSMLYGGVRSVGAVEKLTHNIEGCLSELNMLLNIYRKKEKTYKENLLYDYKWREIFESNKASAGPEGHVCSRLIPEVYEKYFGELKLSRNKGVPSGPGFRFVESVLKELQIVSSKTGKPLGPEAIATHLKGRRKAQSLPGLDDLVPTWLIEY